MEFLPQIAVNTAIIASEYTLLGIAFGLVYSANRYFDMTLAAYIVLGSYISISLAKLGIGPFVVIPLALIIVAVIAYLIELLYYKHLRARKAAPFVFMIASLGVLTVVQAIIAMIFTSNVQVLFSNSIVYHFLSLSFTPVHIATVLLACITAIGTFIVISRTKLGSQLRAIADNEELAITQGVNVGKVRNLTLITAAVIAALAGILVGMDTSIEPLMGMNLLFKGVIAAFIVGLTNVGFAFCGALILASLETAAIWYISGEWKDAVAFAALLIILLMRPKGIISH